MIKSANPIGSSPLGEKHTITLLDKIVSAGSVQYTFILVVYENATDHPCFFVASEVNTMARQFGGGSHFLGVFSGNGHANLGSSDDWGDPKKFFPKAVEIAAEHLDIPKSS
jgi:hypothetical protein